MGVFEKSDPPPPSASVATDAVEVNAQIAQPGIAEPNETVQVNGVTESRDGEDRKPEEKKKAQPGFGNYFVSAPV